MFAARRCLMNPVSVTAVIGFLCITYLSSSQAQDLSTPPADSQQRMQALLEDSPWRSASLNSLSTRAVHSSNPRLNELARLLALEVQTRDNIRLVNILGRNDVINLSDLFYLSGVDSTFIRSDAVEFVKRRNEFTGITRVVNMLARLYEERVVVLAQPSIDSMSALANKTVAMGMPGSGEHITGSLIFQLSEVQVQTIHVNTADALEQLEARKLDAVVLLLGPDGELANDSGSVDGENLAMWWRTLARRDIQVLPVELNDALAEVYVASRLAAADLPGLLDETDSSPTLAVQTILAAYRWSPRNPRHEMASRFVRAFMDSQSTLQEGESARAWQGLDFEFEVPGVPQLGTVRTVLQERADAKALAVEARKAERVALMAQRMTRLEDQQAQIDQLIAERLNDATDEEVNQLQELIEELNALVDELDLDGEN